MIRPAMFVLAVAFFATPSPGQSGAGESRESRVADRFDADGDGRLDNDERAAARAFIRAEREAGRGPGRRTRRGGDPPPPPEAGRQIRTADVDLHAAGDLYDTSILRTIFLDFEGDDWDAEMADFYRTDVEVPVTMTVDGREYRGVGAGYRGNSSFFTVSEGRKRSLAISVDAGDPRLRLYGYRSLNLLNVHADGSFMREVLFGHVARQVYPSYRSNWVRVVINGECWGLYVNTQQINRDSLREAWGTGGAARWKIPANMRAGGTGLTFNGYERSDYEGRYQLKSGDPETAWTALVMVCSRLEQMVPGDAQWLDEILCIDDALRFIALENVLIDSDGYVSRASDYGLFMDDAGRFHPLPYDSNETFRYPGGGPGFDDMDAAGATMSPLQYEDDPARPLISRLLADPALRARYIAHVRHLVRDVLDLERIDPVLERFWALIHDDVRLDTKKLSSYGQFHDGLDGVAQGRRGVPGIRTFITERRTFLLAHPAIDVSLAKIESVDRHDSIAPAPDDDVPITARVTGNVDAGGVILHFATAPLAPFHALPMNASGDGVFTATIPAQAAGTSVRYYVEARTPDLTATTFDPPTAEYRAHTYRVSAATAASAVVINEFQASNATTVADPQGDFDDWIELHNASDDPVDIGGMYITDNASSRAKYRFEPGTIIAPHGYLVIWADRDVDDTPGIHLPFKLSKTGGVLRLTHRDDRGNGVLDHVTYSRQATDRSLARSEDGVGAFVVRTPTPGSSNR